MTLIFKVAECHLKTISIVPTTKIDCKSIVSTLIKNRIICEYMSKIRRKSTDTVVKIELGLNFLEDLLTLHIPVRTFSFAKGQIQSHKVQISKLKSSSLWISLKKIDFKNWRVTLTIKTAIFIATNIQKTKMAPFSYFFLYFALVLIKIRRKTQEKMFWYACLIYLLFVQTVKLLNSITIHIKQK